MSSLVERLRVRTERKPLYNYEELDDDLDFVAAGSGFGEIKPERIIRTDSKDGLCQACGQSGTILSCDTCSYAFHPKCLLPPLKVVPVCSWSCPECVSPLNEIDKILDCEMRPTGADESEASKLGSKQKFVKQYLVKWKALSHLHCTWVPEKEFLKAFKANPRLKTKVNNFHRQMDSMNTSADEWMAIRPEWTTVDRIIAARAGDDEREYLVKWKDLPYDESCWEVESDISAFQPKIERFKEIQSKARKSFKHKSSNREGREKYREFQQYDHSPDFLSGGSLHPYQLEGLNFLRFSWSKHAHVILADEMGLGKTIQSIAYLASLYEENLRPHLVVAPLSTLRNWEREFALWAPHMNVVMYVGSAQARAVVKKYEFFAPSAKAKKLKRLGSFRKEKKRIKFDVLLTSYEMINMDSASLKPIKWECMIVDEGHRLKNKDSKLFLSLKDYFTNHRVLLTGTPLQNNLDELFMLMHFLDAGKFASLEEFQEEFKDINQEEQIVRLHKMLAPHLLRRVKKDVMKELPPKKELILRVELSNLQKEYYRAILTRNYQILTRKGGAQISLNNVVMELRKLCCHAYMLEGVEPDIKDASEAFRQLLESSGKLHLLDKLMVKLKEQGHRVLIYTQFQHMLDLLEDYLSYMKWNYERIDGSVSGVERQVRIDRFNAKNSSRFCFLLSTRAGGLGINLATADTVVIYDSDWNPHADLQAMARAHRLGQTNKVMIFRLITRGTIEERMMEMTKKKMILEHLVVGKMKNQMLNQEELDDIIRYGSKELFADESDEAGKARQIHYDDAAIDRLLDREQITNEEASNEDDEEDGFFKAFKVANFEYIDEVEAAAAAEAEAQKQSPANKLNATNTERASYWEDLLRDRYDVNQVEEASSLGKRRRNKKQVASAEEDNLAGLDDISSDDEEADWIDTEVISSGNAGRRTHISRKRGRADNGEPIPLIEGEGKSFKVLGFNNQQRAQFLQLLMRFGFGNYDWSDFVPRMKQKIPEEINDYGFLVMNHLMEEINDQPCFSDGVPKEGLRIIDVHVRNATMSLIREKVELLAEKPEMPIFEEDIVCRYPALRGGRIWKKEHDKALLLGVLRHGYGRWQSILEDKEFGFQDLVRVEQKLASANDSATQNHEGGNSRSVPDGSAAGHMYQEYCSKDAQRKLVEYIKKRVYLLEKGLNAEYAKIYFAEHEANEHPREEPILVTKHPDAPHSDAPHPGPMEINCKTNDLPALEAITPTEVSAAASDCKFDRMEIARLYNEMGKLITDNTEDSIDAYKGNEYAAMRLRKNISLLEGIYGDVHQLLSVQQQMFSNLDENYVNRKVQSEVVTNVTEAGSLSNNTKTEPDLQAPIISSDPSSDPKDQLAEKVIVLDD